MAQRLIEVEKFSGASQENQAQKLVCDLSVSLGMRRGKNSGS